MSGAEGVLILNVGVAALFVAGYMILALSNPSQRRALGFAACYAMGMVTPLCSLATPRLGMPVITEWVGYLSFLLATASISIAYPAFHNRPAPWRAVAALFAGGVAILAVIGVEPRDTLAYGLAYQLPFAVAAVLAAHTVLSLRVGARPLTLALASVFSLVAGIHLAKPALAIALGSGQTMETYAQTAYALVSQLASGILLLAAGLLLLLIVAQKAITESQVASETDALSGVLNRRGFDRLARARVAAAQASRRPLAAAMFDLDHFKQINDRHGHEAGDAVIAATASALRAGAPADALVGRMGGEEFAVVFEAASPAEARRLVERLRTRLAAPSTTLPPVTASCGVALLRQNETLADLMRRADQAAYRAKREGRDRTCVSEEDGERVWPRAGVGDLSLADARRPHS